MSVGEFETPMQEVEPALGDEMAESNVGQPQPVRNVEDDPADRAEKPFGTHERWYEQGYVG